MIAGLFLVTAAVQLCSYFCIITSSSPCATQPAAPTASAAAAVPSDFQGQCKEAQKEEEWRRGGEEWLPVPRVVSVAGGSHSRSSRRLALSGGLQTSPVDREEAAALVLSPSSVIAGTEDMI